MDAKQVLHRAWQVRPSSLEAPIGVLLVILAKIVLGVPLAVGAAVAAAAVVVFALFTAVTELREEQKETPDA